MAERDEFDTQRRERPWSHRSLDEHAKTLVDLLFYVSAAPRKAKGDTLDFPVLKSVAMKKP